MTTLEKTTGTNDHRDSVNHDSNIGTRKVTAGETRRKGFWGRFLDRLAKANDREFGKKGPCCH